MKIKPESEISCHITLKSVIRGLFYPTRTGNSWCIVDCRGSPLFPADILAAVITDFNNCQTRGKAEDRAGVQTLTEIYSLHKISALWAF